MKIGVVMMFIIAQVVLAKEHDSRRSTDVMVADRAVRCNRKTVTNGLSNMSQMSPTEAQAKT